MACTTKQQSIQPINVLEPIRCEEPSFPETATIADEESRVLRKHLAQVEALRQLERRKSLALIESHRMSFNR
ncbi:MAG: hypothetical protein ACFFC0_08115 [Promethearchaeota archaeon]